MLARLWREGNTYTLWKTIWRFLKELKVELPFDPAIPLLGIYPKENKSLYQKAQNLIQIHPFKNTNKIKRAFSLRICSFAIFRIGLFSIYFYFHNVPNVVIDASLSDRQFGNLWASFLIHCHFPTLLKLIFFSRHHL